MASIEDIRTSIINDPRNARFTAEGRKPVFSAPSTAVITIVGQTPSADAQRSGLCWDDRSGDRLREWLDVDRETFYHSGLFALVPMDFYFLGDGEAGGLLESHHQLHGGQGIGTQVARQGGLGSHFPGVAAQGLHDDVAHFLEFHNSSPCTSKYQLF